MGEHLGAAERQQEGVAGGGERGNHDAAHTRHHRRRHDRHEKELPEEHAVRPERGEADSDRDGIENELDVDELVRIAPACQGALIQDAERGGHRGDGHHRQPWQLDAADEADDRNAERDRRRRPQAGQ